MIRLLFIFSVLLATWLLVRMLSREATIEDAPIIGLLKASEHIQSPILLEDCAAVSSNP